MCHAYDIPDTSKKYIWEQSFENIVSPLPREKSYLRHYFSSSVGYTIYIDNWIPWLDHIHNLAIGFESILLERLCVNISMC